MAFNFTGLIFIKETILVYQIRSLINSSDFLGHFDYWEINN